MTVRDFTELSRLMDKFALALDARTIAEGARLAAEVVERAADQAVMDARDEMNAEIRRLQVNE